MDLAQEVGYLKGMQEATQRELTVINSAVQDVKENVDDLRTTTATKSDLVSLRTELVTKIDEAVEKLQGGSSAQASVNNQTLWQTILKSPVTPMIVVVLAMAATMAIVFSAQTGRPATSFLPYPVTAPVPLPPGGSATSTSTTTVTAPDKQ